MGVKLKELAEVCGGELTGDGEIEIESAAPIETAETGQITFVANDKYLKYLETTAASAVVLSFKTDFERLPVIRHKDPYCAFAMILDSLYPEAEAPSEGVHPSAVVADSAVLGKGSSVGALSHVGDDSALGENCVVMPTVYIGRRVTIGNGCRFYPGVNILDDTKIGDNVILHSGTVIASDGFGYARHEKGIKKVKQVGWVEIGNDVEIGANVTVDRGALGPTRIGNSVKIDNLVQIAHNVDIGDYSIIVSQVGISGSTKLGKRVILAGQVGLVGHIEIGDDAQIGAQSGVGHSLDAGKIYLGTPARDIMKAKRIEACISRLPDLFKRVKEMEKRLGSD
ncbi:MAG: UDP-3-O-(3-hydroxymyristoyl)glucosamine N-acyltransferase [Candidatus Zixiibacteriota bacterium]|nr:MAG: UDP-3-O-(3-hydroxymyristoyl)glucosamine N-acyltransferase [candidate division Zixibacteria bacterium]